MRTVIFFSLIALAAAVLIFSSSGCRSPKAGNSYSRYCIVTGEKLTAKSLSDPALYAGYEGKRYYFCRDQCKPKFEEDPEKWIAKPAKPETGGHAGHQH